MAGVRCGLQQLLVDAARSYPDKLAFVTLDQDQEQDETITYSQLLTSAARAAYELRAAGLSPGSRVLISPDLDPLWFIATLFGCFQVGVVPVPSPHTSGHERRTERARHLLADAACACALVPTKPVGEAVEQALPARAVEIGISGGAIAELDDGPRAHDLALIQYTSGTASAARGVLLTHECIRANLMAMQRRMEISADTIGVNWLPLSHDMGLFGAVLNTVAARCTTHLLSPNTVALRPSAWLKAISRIGADASGGANWSYDWCVRRVEASKDLDLRSWTLAAVGAERVRADTLRSFAQKFSRCGFRYEAFFPCYGMAEATVFATGGQRAVAPTVRDVSSLITQPSGRVWSGEVVSCGQAADDHDVVIVDAVTGVERADGCAGEIWLAGPSIGIGYVRGPQDGDGFGARLGESDRSYYRTGDLGVVSRGELFIIGRLKDIVVVRGVNYHAEEIEHAAGQAHAKLAGLPNACFAVDVDGQEEAVLVQSAHVGTVDEAHSIATSIRCRVGEDVGLDLYEVVLVRPRSIPRTTSGKTNREACRAALDEKALQVIWDWRRGRRADLGSRG